MESKAWVRPELVVVTRGTPEESVLTACKTAGVQGPAPNNVYGLCWTVEECAHCAEWAPS